MSNSLIVGYTSHDESRGAIGDLFPFVDIWEGGQPYTSFGSEPFTPNNELRYKTFQLQDNFTQVRQSALADLRRQPRALRVGERVLPRLAEQLRLQLAGRLLRRRNGYLRQSEPDDLAGHAAPLPGALHEHPGRGQAAAAAGSVVRRRATRRTSGGRVEPHRHGRAAGSTCRSFGDTGFRQRQRRRAHFRDENGQPVQYSTGELPDPKILWSPRVGINWDVIGNQRRRSAAAPASSRAGRSTSGSPTRSATPAC